MNILSRIFSLYTHARLRTKLILTYTVLIAVPALLTGYGYYNTSSGIITDNAKSNTLELVKKINGMVDMKFSIVEEKIFFMNVDRELYDVFISLDTNSQYNIYQTDKRVSKLLYKYFPLSEKMYEGIYSVNLVTSYFTFGRNAPVLVPKNGFIYSRPFESIRKEWKSTYWVPSFNLKDVLGEEEKPATPFKELSLFSVVREINCSSVENGIIRNMPNDIERPVLIVNFKSDMFEKAFGESISADGAQCYVFTSEGKTVWGNDSTYATAITGADWFGHMKLQKSGNLVTEIGGQKMLVCYDTSRVTQWVSVVVIPYRNLLGELASIRFYTIYICLVLAVLSILVGFFISGRITKPIKKLLVAIRNMGQGKFTNRIEVKVNDEMGYLIQKFNDMNEDIHKLIDENYVSKLREKEAQIMALNLQFEPHFMYNTLNIINLMAIENNQKDISRMIMSLSNMLRYTIKKTSELVEFQQDLEYCRSYIHIMDKRYESKFTVEYDMDEALNGYLVPKLFLQPFIENAIIHGFSEITYKGLLRISGRIEGDLRVFRVEDNGRGMSTDQIEMVMNSSPDRIGVRNVDKRIRILFGEEFGVRIEPGESGGTRVIITMPLQ